MKSEIKNCDALQCCRPDRRPHRRDADGAAERVLHALHMLMMMWLATSALADFAAKPNLVFFMADDLGWNNVEWHNPTQMKTPNGAQLVKEGIELDRHYVFLYCSPSRSSFMTGRLPYHVQQANRQNCDLTQGAPRNMTFIAAKLKQAGYQTHHIVRPLVPRTAVDPICLNA